MFRFSADMHVWRPSELAVAVHYSIHHMKGQPDFFSVAPKVTAAEIFSVAPKVTAAEIF
jgi:hypothetical protein